MKPESVPLSDLVEHQLIIHMPMLVSALVRRVITLSLGLCLLAVVFKPVVVQLVIFPRSGKHQTVRFSPQQ